MSNEIFHGDSVANSSLDETSPIESIEDPARDVASEVDQPTPSGMPADSRETSIERAEQDPHSIAVLQLIDNLFDDLQPEIEPVVAVFSSLVRIGAISERINSPIVFTEEDRKMFASRLVKAIDLGLIALRSGQASTGTEELDEEIMREQEEDFSQLIFRAISAMHLSETEMRVASNAAIRAAIHRIASDHEEVEIMNADLREVNQLSAFLKRKNLL